MIFSQPGPLSETDSTINLTLVYGGVRSVWRTGAIGSGELGVSFFAGREEQESHFIMHGKRGSQQST